MGLHLNLGPGQHQAPAPWINIDVHEDDLHRPDMVVDGADPFASFEPGSAERVYLGHVLEHVPWPDLDRLLGQVRAVLEPGGLVLATGPDVFRTIRMWHDGQVGWELVTSVLEHQDRIEAHWPEAGHHWCCHEQRLLGVLERAGFDHVAPTTDFDGWPVTNWSDWQCAARGVA